MNAVASQQRPQRHHQHEPVPAEFVGKARAFRTSLVQPGNAAIDELESIVLALAPRQPRPQLLEKVRQRWIAMPDRGRLMCIAKCKGIDLQLAELRVVAGTIVTTRWEDGGDEPGLAIRATAIVRSTREGGERASIIEAHIGLHGLARFYQRAWDNSEATLFADLQQIDEDYEKIAMKGGDFALSVSNDGLWAGRVVKQPGSHPILAIRTYRVEGG